MVMNNTTNVPELNKLIRQMQDESIAKHLAANNFNQKAADIVSLGASDKMKARGWPIGTQQPKTQGLI